jgi:hypothetical protein
MDLVIAFSAVRRTSPINGRAGKPARGTFPDRGMIISPTGQPQELIDGKPGVGDDAARVPV